jgi:hypothetical protein
VLLLILIIKAVPVVLWSVVKEKEVGVTYMIVGITY